ncbi:MAG TPA: type II toxin-antitoxin system Phd/YefM family antitoxin [Candidatus Saccharimonadales bacterium]|jgi:PHD/YefM family antitoxin component YafN of YafNO toxin-antitoxin module|nr:type II toxin-antitoxin system Phd/YefM family antitoxin [Candidatus Saccharimonadales bacterium]
MTTIVKATELRDSYATIAKKVRGGKTMAIITKRGRPDLALIDLDYLEDLLESQDTEFLKTLKVAASDKTYTLEEVFSNLKA